MRQAAHYGAFLLAVALAVPPAAAQAPAVVLRFENPERFTDVGMRRSEPQRVRTGLLEELRGPVEREAAARIPPGSHLEIVVTDVDMAGSIRPSAQFGEELRTVGESSPPRIDLRFVLKGADGATLGEGRRKLRNPQFLFGALPSSSPMRHERALLEDWLEREFPSRR